MKVRIFYSVENSVYRVSLRTEDWSENDLRLMEQFGEPEINIGGEVSYEQQDAEPVSVMLADSWRRIHSEPITETFDLRDSPYAKEFANAWADNMVAKINSAYTSLRAHVDDFTREIVHNFNAIPTTCSDAK